MARRGNNIFKRVDGRYEGRYIKEYSPEGKAKYGAVYAKTYAETKDKLDKIKPLNSRTALPRPTVLKDALSEYLLSVKNLIKPSTQGIYSRYITNYILPYFGNIQCSKLTKELTQGFVDRKLEDGLSVKTIQSVFLFLKAGLKECVADVSILEVNLPHHICKEVEVFSTDEQKRLELVAKNSDYSNYIGVILCLYTGIRIGELCGLMWTDIDFERGVLHIRRTIQRIADDSADGNKTKIAFLPPKSQSSARKIPLPTFISSILKEHQLQGDSIYVLSRNGEPIEPRSYQYRFKSLLDSANIKQVNFHTTRHTFATRALENGFDIKTLSEILGHSSATVTLNKYAHSLDEHKRNRMESLSVIYQ